MQAWTFTNLERVFTTNIVPPKVAPLNARSASQGVSFQWHAIVNKAIFAPCQCNVHPYLTPSQGNVRRPKMGLRREVRTIASVTVSLAVLLSNANLAFHECSLQHFTSVQRNFQERTYRISRKYTGLFANVHI